MKCSVCGTNNEEGFKFCVKCGSNLENPQEVNYEQVDMGGYHAEEEYSSDTAGFRMASGTFTISDKSVSSQSSQLFTSEELNDTDEEFDFSKYDNEDDTDLGTETVQQNVQGMQGINPQYMQGMGSHYMQGMNPQFMQGMGMQGINPQAMQGMNPQGMQGMNPQGMQGMSVQGMQGINPQTIQNTQSGQQVQQNMNQMYPNQMIQPQIIGYDMNGMPIYQAQPIMYAQPQFMGYDPNGVPIYQPQPIMYAQPQFMGYDPNGVPIYQPQPMMYAQPQPMGEQQGIPPYQQMGVPNTPSGVGEQQDFFSSKSVQKEKKPEEKAKKSDDFWDFFDGGQGKTKHKEESSDDFFGKTSHNDMGEVTVTNDIDRLKKLEKKKYSYMGDTPIVDADKLAVNESSKYNKMFMRGTAQVNADDLKSNIKAKQHDIMGVTEDMSTSQISKNEHYKSRVSMAGTAQVNADELEAYVPEKRQAIMAGADHAVEAMPKKRTTYNDEIDAIELPEYMQAKKTSKKDTPEIPSLPEL